jgi:hypothetical protein
VRRTRDHSGRAPVQRGRGASGWTTQGHPLVKWISGGLSMAGPGLPPHGLLNRGMRVPVYIVAGKPQVELGRRSYWVLARPVVVALFQGPSNRPLDSMVGQTRITHMCLRSWRIRSLIQPMLERSDGERGELRITSHQYRSTER